MNHDVTDQNIDETKEVQPTEVIEEQPAEVVDEQPKEVVDEQPKETANEQTEETVAPPDEKAASSAFTFGLISLISFFFCTPLISLILGIVAMIKANAAIKLLGPDNQQAKTGRLLAIITIVLDVLTFVMCVVGVVLGVVGGVLFYFLY